MNKPSEKMRIGTILQTGGQHVGAWRHPDSAADVGLSFESYKQIAAVAERGKLDFIFIGDILSLRDWPLDVICRSAFTSLQIEPLTLMAALSSLTSRLGFVITASSSYVPPYLIARQYAGLDLITGGRVGWNVVTSTQRNEAHLFGRGEPMDHAERYRMAAENVAIVKGLWGSVKPGVFVGDKETGILFNKGKLEPFTFKGDYLSSSGILNVPPSPQGRPVIAQAGASGPGRDLAASIGEIIFSIAHSIDVAKTFYEDIHARMKGFGRAPSEARIMTGLIPVVAGSTHEARAKLESLNAYIHRDLAIASLSDYLGGIDLTTLNGNEPLPGDLPVSNNSKTLYEQIHAVGKARSFTLDELALNVASRMTHQTVAGTPGEIADFMINWFDSGASDGFLVSASLLPRDLAEFVEHVIPVLQSRGRFREDYEADTLRGNLGLPIAS